MHWHDSRSLVLPKHLGGNDRTTSTSANTYAHNSLRLAKLVVGGEKNSEGRETDKVEDGEAE